MVQVVKLTSCDGETFIIDEIIIEMCATVKNMLRGKSAFRNSLGGQFSIEGSLVILKKEGRVLASLSKMDETEAIVSLPDVKGNTLQKVIDYCRFHSDSGKTDKEKRLWDSEFVQVKQSVLCELASASYYLDIRPLVNLTSRAIATQISASSLAMRCRLQRKMHRRKQEEKEQKMISYAPPAKENDERSVEDLLSFINEDSNKKPKKKSKKKKKKNKDADAPPNPNSAVSEESISNSTTSLPDSNDESISNSTITLPDSNDESSSTFTSSAEFIENNVLPPENNESSEITLPESEIHEAFDFPFPELEETQSTEEEIDPEMKDALDREIEEFRQRLESINQQHRDSPKIQLPLSVVSSLDQLVGVH